MAVLMRAPTLDDALAALRELASRAEEGGSRILVFCEDRLTLSAERALLASLGGSFTAEVSTFARFVAGDRRVLSKEGSVMAISAIISACEGELHCFRRRAARAVYETIAQLSASRVDADMLEVGAGETEGVLSHKLGDLALIMRRYREFLTAHGMMDESGYLALLPDAIRARDLSHTHVCFFAFPSFTRQGREAVRTALACARAVTGIFLSGREHIYTNEGARIFAEACREFAPPEQVALASSMPGEARRLFSGLFFPMRTAQEPSACIRRIDARDEAEEYARIAALIKRHAAEGVRYREMAMLLPGQDSCAALERVFHSFGIPYYLDRKRPFSEHPLSRFVLAVLEAAASGGLPEEVDRIAANFYFGEGDSYRNYLLRYGAYRGGYRRAIRSAEELKGFDHAEMERCRARMTELVGCFPGARTAASGAEYVAGVRALMEKADAERRTEELSAHFTGAERTFLSIEPLEEILSEIESVAGGMRFTAREFAQVLQSGLEAKEIAMIPQASDVVYVGDATDSRLERVRILFAAGMTDALPRTSEDTAVITDGEIGRLNALKVEIEPAIAQVNARARESLALNLCAFSERLYLSVPLRSGGREAVPSGIIADAGRLFVLERAEDAFPYDCSERQPALVSLYALRNAIQRGESTDISRYSSLYLALERMGELPALPAGQKKDIPAIAPLYFAHEISPSALEGYFRCPYRGFGDYVLRLRERQEDFAASDAGSFVHAVLERSAVRFNTFADEAACRAFARTCGGELLQLPQFSALADTAAGRYAAERLISEGEEIAAAAFRAVARSAFRVEATEKSIALPELALAGKTDRVDVSGDYVRVIDYKTGHIPDGAGDYYMGTSLQLPLYLRAATAGRRSAGAFYFPARNDFDHGGAGRFRMKGFFSCEEEVLRRMDPALEQGGESALFEWDGTGGAGGLEREDFERFLDYAVLVARRAEEEMRQGNICPSPKEGACGYCKLHALCAFCGEERKKRTVSAAQIAAIVRRETGEE